MSNLPDMDPISRAVGLTGFADEPATPKPAGFWWCHAEGLALTLDGMTPGGLCLRCSNPGRWVTPTEGRDLQTEAVKALALVGPGMTSVKLRAVRNLRAATGVGIREGLTLIEQTMTPQIEQVKATELPDGSVVADSYFVCIKRGSKRWPWATSILGSRYTDSDVDAMLAASATVLRVGAGE